MTPTCRACAAALGRPVVELERMPLTDDFISTANLDRSEYLRDIRIQQCDACGLVQNPEDFDHEGYYQDYQYSSGHSAFVQRFMHRYAQVACEHFEALNKRWPKSVLEIGSGDGEQLKQFRQLDVKDVLGVEPSEFLARAAEAAGIPTEVGLFGAATRKRVDRTFDLCISSYTFDHVRSPLDYLQTAHAMLVDNGVLAFEVHNLEKIVERTEYCLFEHEHTVYLTPESAARLVASQGFEVVAVNPIVDADVRGNSLIVVARKVGAAKAASVDSVQPDARLAGLNERLRATIARIDAWTDTLPVGSGLVGFGAGGRGVMTLAALGHPERFTALFDSNYPSGRYMTPKTRIPIVGPDGWRDFSRSHCLVFSFGYLDEITRQLTSVGFAAENIHSLADFFPADGR